MTADTITPSRIYDLSVVLELALQIIDNLRDDVVTGDASPEEAAAIVNHTISKINNAAK